MNQEQIDKIRKLREEGKTQVEIAKALGTSQRVISYWLGSNEKRKEIAKKVVDSFKRLTKEQRSLVYKRRLPYLKKYQKTRYHNDEKFKEKCKIKSKKYYEKRKDLEEEE